MNPFAKLSCTVCQYTGTITVPRDPHSSSTWTIHKSTFSSCIASRYKKKFASTFRKRLSTTDPFALKDDHHLASII